jgi:hypothetical protein
LNRNRDNISVPLRLLALFLGLLGGFEERATLGG